ncbi:MAG: hypothetical protein EOO27_24070 [Comamonadaceae bacterium]|nr:MAG: hypothetical protein EOO27_24070 [Comamonadaceae bacterium]
MTIQCVVYVLRRSGAKLSKEAERSNFFVGWLYLGRDTRRVEDEKVARLFRGHKEGATDMIEPLQHAKVKSIDRGGILITGQEPTREPNVTMPQTWWCVPGLLDDTTLAR